MLIDTHCHINIMIKKDFDVPLSPEDFAHAVPIIKNARAHDVTRIINVGTSLVESMNCVSLAQKFPNSYAVIGIHPNDCTASWREDFLKIKKMLTTESMKHHIIGIGETGLDFHYPDYNFNRQKDAFKAQIELALEYDLGLVVHTRDAQDETLYILQEYKHDMQRGIIHCFSGDTAFANEVLALNYALGIGGTLTYPKNNEFRTIAQTTPLSSIVLETDSPFLPPQPLRGKQNEPANIQMIAHYLAELRNETYDTIAQSTTNTAARIFKLDSFC